MKQLDFLSEILDNSRLSELVTTTNKSTEKGCIALGLQTISETSRALGSFFICVKRAEEIIQDRMKAAVSQEDKEKIYNSFKYLGAMHLYEMNPRLYEHHCNQIIDRILINSTETVLNYGTDAECLLACMNASFKSPLNEMGMQMYEQLFMDVFGYLPESDFYGNSFSHGDDYTKNEAIREINNLRKRIGNVRTLNCEK